MLTVSSTADPVSLTAGTLRYEVNQANIDARAGISDTISFSAASPNLSGLAINLLQGQLELGQGGAGSGKITIDGSSLSSPITINGSSPNRVFLVDFGVQAVLNDLIITNGSVAADGGGIDNAGTLTLSNSTVSNNQSTGVNFSSPYGGGGVANEATGVLTITATTITGNSAADTGGGVLNVGSMTVQNSTISNNTNLANGFGPGGIDLEGGFATIQNTTVTGNQSISSDSGGGIGVYIGDFSNSDTASISDSTISGNTSSGSSGGGLDVGLG